MTTSADTGPTQVRDRCVVDEAGRQLLGAAMRQMQLSARAYHRVLTCACGTGAGKLARTIADLAGAEAIHLRSAAAGGVKIPPECVPDSAPITVGGSDRFVMGDAALLAAAMLFINERSSRGRPANHACCQCR